MIFTCNNCNAQYKISDDRIPSKGAKVKCKKCGNIITIKPKEVSLPESDSFQNEATVVQRSPFADESDSLKEATRVISQEQAAGIFKSLINEHSQRISEGGVSGFDETHSDRGYEDYQEGTGYSGYSIENQESPDDRLTSVYESSPSMEESEATNETEQQVNEMLGYNEEEDISREATRVVSTEQLKQIVGEEDIQRREPIADKPEQNYYSQQQQSYVAPKSRGEWYVAIGQMQVGPLSLNEVEEKWGRGEINSTTLVWKAGMADWQPLMYVQELSHLVPPIQESKVDLEPPLREFKPETVSTSKDSDLSSTSSTFPSLDELTKQEEELSSQKEEETPIDWKPSAGEALVSLVQDELESMKRGFSTDIPIGVRTEGSVTGASPAENVSLPFERSQEPLAPSPIIGQSTPPVVAEQPVIVNPPPYQAPYPTAYPPIYSQPPQKVEKSRFVPILVISLGVFLIVGLVGGYLLYTKLSGEKISQPAQQIQQQQITQPIPVQPQPQQIQQPPPTQQQIAQTSQQLEQKQEEPLKKEETQKLVQAREEEPKKETQEPKKEVQKQKVAMKEDRQQVKRPKKEEEEMPPPPPKEEKRPKKAEVAEKEEEPPPKKKPSKGSDPLLDFEGEQGSKGSSGGLPKTLTQEQILEVVKANIGRIKTCMAEQAQRDPSIKGKLVIGWDIQPNGKTKNVQIKTPQFKGTYIGTCISSVVSDFNFPKFSGPPIPIEFPFNIK